MKYIRSSEVEKLLSLYPEIDVIAQNLQLQIRNIDGDSTDKINDSDGLYSLCIGNKSNDGTPYPPAGNVSDKTGNLAISYDLKKQVEVKELKNELLTELTDIELCMKKIDNSMSTLSEVQNKVIKAKYWDKLTWNDIARKLEMDKRRAQRVNGISICFIVRTTKITISEYERIVKIVENEAG